MSEQQNTDSQTNEESTGQQGPTEEQHKQVLRGRLDQMGIKYSNNASLARLQQQYSEALDGKKSTEEAGEVAAPVVAQNAPQSAKPTKTIRQHMIETKLKLVRIRISSMDPKKRDLPGEIITVGNSYLGTVRKYVPYGEATDNGYHVPYCIYEYLRDRTFTDIRTKRIKGTGQIQVTTREVKEFAIEVLEPLTAKELDDLRKAQLAAGSVE